MDSEPRPTPPSPEPVPPVSAASPTPPAVPANQATPAAAHEPLAISDDAAQSLLALNGVDTRPKAKLPISFGMLVTIGVVVGLLIVASVLIRGVSAKRPAQTSPPAASSPQRAPVTRTDGQINQYVQSCSNAATALSEC